ncbi:hypothetical protein ACIF8W_02560 [Streptomyces sp. NPDC085639]|uniref:hypothetical protein n=1 Tax=Streptomyces sp. NPDC085639 TaxID=3365734 RepID=UPI0037D09970
MLDQPAEACPCVSFPGGRSRTRNPGNLGHHLLRLGLPPDRKHVQPQALGAPVQLQEVQQSAGVHGQQAVQIHHQIPLVRRCARCRRSSPQSP